MYMQDIFPHCLQFNLDETLYLACSSLVKYIDHYVIQQNTYIAYIAYQLLITTTILITIKEDLTISESHFKHGQNRETKN